MRVRIICYGWLLWMGACASQVPAETVEVEKLAPGQCLLLGPSALSSASGAPGREHCLRLTPWLRSLEEHAGPDLRVLHAYGYVGCNALFPPESVEPWVRELCAAISWVPEIDLDLGALLSCAPGEPEEAQLVSLGAGVLSASLPRPGFNTHWELRFMAELSQRLYETGLASVDFSERVVSQVQHWSGPQRARQAWLRESLHIEPGALVPLFLEPPEQVVQRAKAQLQYADPWLRLRLRGPEADARKAALWRQLEALKLPGRWPLRGRGHVGGVGDPVGGGA